MALAGGWNGQVIGGGAGPPANIGGVTPGGSNLPMNVPLKTSSGSNSKLPVADPYGSDPLAAGSETTVDSLGAYARQQFTLAKNSRTVIDTLLLQCLRQRRGEYDPDELAMMTETVKTFYNITATKCRAGEAWMTDILTASGDRLYQLDPTPIPNVPQFVKDMVTKQLQKEVAKYGMPPEAAIRDRIDELADVAYRELMVQARAGTTKMQRKIDDQLAEANFIPTLQAFISDLMVYPYAVLKAPVIRRRRRLKWEGSEPIATMEAQMTIERVSPFDFYFAPWCVDPQEAFVVEVMHMPRQSLVECKGMPNFNDDKLQLALSTYVTGHQELVNTTTQREVLERQSMVTLDNGDVLDVLNFWGSVRGDLLKDWGLKVEDVQATYEADIWVLGGICVRAVLNPDPMQRRPYYVTSYEKVPGSMVGRAVTMLMRPNQQIINSGYRALRRNMGLASGPFAEVDSSRLNGQQAPEEIMPAMVKLVEPDLVGRGATAYHFHKIDSHAQELESIINEEIKKCDDATGIPAYAYGNPQVAGAGRTVGGLAMLMGNAAKGIKQVIVNIEQDVLEPMITAFYNYNMLYDPDQQIKVDAQVQARGPTAVLARETAAAKRMEMLQVVGPFIPTGIIPKNGLATLLREVMKSSDFPVDKIIPDPELEAQLQAVAGPQQGAPPGAPPQPGQPPQPPPAMGAPPPPGTQGAPAMVPQAPGQGTGLVPQPDARSGPAGPVVQQMNRGGL
jgi:hypothetical protein